MTPYSKVYNMDCMEGMKQFKEGYFDLAIVDPPYGIGQDWKKRHKGVYYPETTYKNDQIPGEEYFKELFRVSKHQIIWGYNYYVDFLGPTNYLIVWDKLSGNNPEFKYSKGEIAFTSKRIPLRFLQVPWDGYRMGKETGIKKIHPHQKPIELYRRLLQEYAEPMNCILDTHVGSGSNRIACYDMGFSFVGYEIDPDHYQAQEKRFKQHSAQQRLFV